MIWFVGCELCNECFQCFDATPVTFVRRWLDMLSADGAGDTSNDEDAAADAMYEALKQNTPYYDLKTYVRRATRLCVRVCDRCNWADVCARTAGVARRVLTDMREGNVTVTGDAGHQFIAVCVCMPIAAT
jgi:hypothetical protein